MGCEKTGQSFKTYYHLGMLSPKGTKLLYRVAKEGYSIVDLASGERVFIQNENWHPFFSPDDNYICIGGQVYDAKNGSAADNPFPFDIPKKLTYFDTCDVISRENIMAVQCGTGFSPIQIWDYNHKNLCASIEDDFIVKHAAFAFTKNTLVVHSDYGVISVYNCNVQ